MTSALSVLAQNVKRFVAGQLLHNVVERRAATNAAVRRPHLLLQLRENQVRLPLRLSQRIPH